ncbi:Uncharacterised protein [Bordetella pertussis]|nr:Uncharacterised protein [Bordetella pertussis]CPP68022.1 Uncharacterised protein [Bordetella pertussis]
MPKPRPRNRGPKGARLPCGTEVEAAIAEGSAQARNSEATPAKGSRSKTAPIAKTARKPSCSISIAPTATPESCPANRPATTPAMLRPRCVGGLRLTTNACRPIHVKPYPRPTTPRADTNHARLGANALATNLTHESSKPCSTAWRQPLRSLNLPAIKAASNPHPISREIGKAIRRPGGKGRFAAGRLRANSGKKLAGMAQANR